MFVLYPITNRRLRLPTVTRSLYAIPVSMLLALFIGPILRDGMFLDGMVYTNIARNLAAGHGSFWQPLVYREGAVFYEHPVLLPYLQSFFFSALGDGRYVEDIYNTVILLATVGTMYLVWSAVVEKTQRKLFFFPFLLWVLGQENQLRFPNTMLEGGTTLLLLLTTWLYLKFQQRNALVAQFVVGAGVFVSLFCKGPIGLFLLVLPFAYRLLIKRQYSWSALIVPAGIVFSGFTLLLLWSPEAQEFISTYFRQQILAAIAGERTENIAASRFDFAGLLVLMNLPALILVGLVYLLKEKEPIGRTYLQESRLFLLLGLAAILPLVITIKQASYYQIPSLPFFILGGSLFLTRRLSKLVAWVEGSTIRRRTVRTLGGSGLLVSLLYAGSMVGTLDRRDVTTVDLADEIATVLKNHQEPRYNFRLASDSIGPASGNAYSLMSYLYRYHWLSLNDREKVPMQLIFHSTTGYVPPEGNVLLERDGYSLVMTELDGR